MSSDIPYWDLSTGPLTPTSDLIPCYLDLTQFRHLHVSFSPNAFPKGKKAASTPYHSEVR